MRKAGVFLALLVALVITREQVGAATLSDDFNDGNAEGWSTLDPLGALIGEAGSVTFPGGNTCRLEHPGISQQAYVSSVGMARVSFWRPDFTMTSQFQMSVDLLDLGQAAQRQEFGLNAQARDIGPGTTSGYLFHYLPLEGLLPGAGNGFEIARTFGEVYQAWMTGDYSGPYHDANWYPGCNSSKPYTLDPAKDYRMVFLGSNLRFEGRVYELTDLSKPVCIVVCNFSQAAGGAYDFKDGIPGLQVQNLFGGNPSGQIGLYTGPCATTIDDFTASDTFSAYPGTPAVPRLTVQSSGGTTLVAWPGENLGLWALQQAPSLQSGVEWKDVNLWEIEYDAASGQRKYVATNSPMAFFRLRKL